MSFELLNKKNLPRIRPSRGLLFCTAFWLFSTALASDAEPLPEPLTLDYVLALDVALHPDIQIAAANLQSRRASERGADAVNDITAQLHARAQFVEPAPSALDQSRGDHQISLLLRKPLYDFGRSSAAQAAAGASVQSGESLLFDAVNQQRVAIMQRFFDVLLADLAFIRDNEAMSMAFVRLDRGRSRNELGQLSDIELSALEDRYQKTRLDYFTSQSHQRNTRSLLANALNRPGELVSEVAEPALWFPPVDVTDVAEFQQQAAQHNPVLRALRYQLQAAERQIAATRAGKKPKLDSEIEVSEFARESSSHNEWRAAIILDVPLLMGDQVNAQVAQRLAERRLLQSRLQSVEMDIAQSVLEHWQQLQTMTIARQQTKTQAQFRDLYLDRSRALYEMEVQSDLGDAMVQISDARLQLAKVEYQLLLTWVRLQALTGKKVELPKEPGRDTTK